MPYSSLDMSKVLRDLLKKKQEQLVSGKADDKNINQIFNEYVQDRDRKNMSHVEHFKQIC